MNAESIQRIQNKILAAISGENAGECYAILNLLSNYYRHKLNQLDAAKMKSFDKYFDEASIQKYIDIMEKQVIVEKNKDGNPHK